ncbi:MAG: ABC transporter permease [Planctomycetes bacterium]|nr:ABC transporter permease [Planctomycetota bacterium]
MTERPARKPRAYWRLVLREFFKRRLSVAALAATLLQLLVALLAPYLANEVPIVLREQGKICFPSTFDYPRFRTTDWAAFVRDLPSGDWVLMPPLPVGPSHTDIFNRLDHPSRRHLMGTDDLGRDVLARMIWGGRISLSVGFVAVGIAVIIGIIFGSIAGYFGGAADLVISRVIEVVICFPTFFLLLTIIALVARMSIFYLMLAIGIVGWTGIARLVRGEFLRLREQDFVVAARALGVPARRIIFRHILPNAIAPVLVSATFGIAGAILTESGLSFLGFGVPPPTASWGSILSLARQYVYQAWWLTAFPGAAIFFSILCYNLIGEGLRDAVDPRLRI